MHGKVFSSISVRALTTPSHANSWHDSFENISFHSPVFRPRLCFQFRPKNVVETKTGETVDPRPIRLQIFNLRSIHAARKKPKWLIAKHITEWFEVEIELKIGYRELINVDHVKGGRSKLCRLWIVQWFSTCYGVKSESEQSMTVYWVIGTIERPIGLTSFFAGQSTFLNRRVS